MPCKLCKRLPVVRGLCGDREVAHAHRLSVPAHQSGGTEGWTPYVARGYGTAPVGGSVKMVGMALIDGVEVKLTNLDKVMYPATGTIKADIVDPTLTVSQAHDI